MNLQPDKIKVTSTRLNVSPYLDKNITYALIITNLDCAPIHGLTLTVFPEACKANSYSYADGSAILFFEGKKFRVKAASSENKITLTGIFVPARESILVFYRLHKLTN